MLRSTVGAISLLLSGLTTAGAQGWPFHYPEPPDSSVRLVKDVRYARVDTLNLAMDVYMPARGASPMPTLVLYSLFWPPDKPGRESNTWLQSWARIAAANGIVAVIPDLRAEAGTGTAATPSRPIGDDFERALEYIADHAAEFRINRDRLVVFASSGAVWPGFSAVEDARRTEIKAAVMYYGASTFTAFRLDLPVLYVRAGMDSRGTNDAFDRLAALALAQNAPITLINHPTGRHGFEGRSDNAMTRQIIDQTIQFIKYATHRAQPD